jgi:DEAD/DEAH box helicase domain-containing protein
LSFAAPGKDTVVLGSKPAKAFGAPESDDDEGSEDEGSDGGAAEDDEESGHAVVEDKKKSKIAKGKQSSANSQWHILTPPSSY